MDYQAKQTIRHLAWFDVLILTIIFWGEGIFFSTRAYLLLLQGATTLEENLAFSVSDNYVGLAFQAAYLIIGIVYLRLRHFDFQAWHIHITPKAVGYGALIFFGGAILLDTYSLLTDPLTAVLPFPVPITAVLGNETVSAVIYALFNGVYEELYFLGICLAVSPSDMKWSVPFSLLVRVSFHTYQGMLNALGIGVLFGTFAWLLYRRSKDKNLMPFFVAHSIADVLGLGILGFFY